MEAFTFYLPTEIIFARGSIEQIGEEVAKLGDKCLVVSGKTFARKSGYLDFIDRKLTESNLRAIVFDEVEPNPSIETIYKGAKVAKTNGCDIFVGFGGGSVIDAAKAIAFLASNDVKLEDHFYPNVVTEPSGSIVAIPTTCGTGSEVTKYAVITDVAARKKEVLTGLPILPKVALLDANVLNGLPKHMVAYTGFDALSHSLEAILSKASNDVSDMFAIESIRVIHEYLVGAYEGCPEARERLFYGSMLAGVAINFAGTIVVHGMAYYLTTYHGIHHGLANALMLPHFLRFEQSHLSDKLQRVATNLRLEDVEAVLRMVEDLADDVGIPKSLVDLGIEISELDSMVSDAMSYDRSIEKTPVEISDKAIREIYNMAFTGRGRAK